MQEADVRIGALNDLTIHLEHQSQHAVRSRVLWPKVQREILDLRHAGRP
jgi:hypothetical protein